MPRLTRYIATSLWPDDVTLRQERFFLLLSAALLAAAWPPLPLGFLAVIALVLPLDIISGRPFGQAFRKGYFFSFFYHCFSLYWIGWVTVPGTIAAIAIISLYNAFIFGIYGAWYRRHRLTALIAMPFLWVGMEYFRTLFQIAFPWSNLSYTQGAYTAFIQICEFVGDAGISVIVVAVNILIWQAWRRRHVWCAVGAGLLIVAPTVYGAVVLAGAGPADAGPIRVALLQGDVSIEEKWDPNNREFNFRLYDSLSVAAVSDTAAGRPDLLIWPETSAPAYLLGNYRLTALVSRSARRAGAPMLVGTLDYTRYGEDSLKYYNAALQFDADGSYRVPYHKNKLVPFAETVPYGEYIPWLANLSLGWSDFEHGDNLGIYDNEFGSYGTLICYEVIFPELVNEYVRNGADFLVNITNDTWYGYSSGPYQHAGMAVFRAVENRIYIARTANSGFSYFVDWYGRMYKKSRLYERTIIHGRLAPHAENTVFNRTGPLVGRFGLLLIVLTSCILLILWIKDKLGS